MKQILLLFSIILIQSTAYSQDRLFLDEHKLFAGEALTYTYVNEIVPTPPPLYICLVDLSMKKIVDFGYHTREDKIIRGEINLDRELAPGYYAAMAFSAGQDEVYYEQFWVVDPLWHSQSNALSVLDNQDSIQLSIPSWKANWRSVQASLIERDDTVSTYTFESAESNFAFPLTEQEQTWLKLAITDTAEQTYSHVYLFQDESKANVKSEPTGWSYSQNKDTLIVQVVKAHSLEIRYQNQVFVELYPNTAEDILLPLVQLPSGKLHFCWVDTTQAEVKHAFTFINTPKLAVVEQNEISLTAFQKDYMVLPNIKNPWVKEGTHFIHTSILRRNRVAQNPAKYRGAITIRNDLTLEHDLLVLYLSGFEKIPKLTPLIYTYGDFTLDLEIDESGEFRMNQSFTEVLGYNEGRARLNDFSGNQKINAKYPPIDWFSQKLKELDWAFVQAYSEPNRQQDNMLELSEENLTQDWMQGFDLEEVIVQEKEASELYKEVMDNPFSPHWLNTDYTCIYGMLFCSSHPVGAGNRPGAKERRPLHISPWGKPVYVTLSHVSNVPWDDLIKRAPRVIYTWDVSQVLDQIETVKAPKQNLLTIADTLMAQNNGHLWKAYSGQEKLEIKAPSMPGFYLVSIQFWNLLEDVGTTITYELEVKN